MVDVEIDSESSIEEQCKANADVKLLLIDRVEMESCSHAFHHCCLLAHLQGGNPLSLMCPVCRKPCSFKLKAYDTRGFGPVVVDISKDMDGLKAFKKSIEAKCMGDLLDMCLCCPEGAHDGGYEMFDVKLAESLICKGGFNVNDRINAKYNSNFLVAAVKMGNIEAVRYLLGKGADARVPDVRSRMGALPLAKSMVGTEYEPTYNREIIALLKSKSSSEASVDIPMISIALLMVILFYFC